MDKHSKVKKSNFNPVLHYIYYGYEENKNPSDNFNTKYYLNKYRDVKKSGINPLYHYIRFGKNEGRFPNKSEESESLPYLINSLKKSKLESDAKIKYLERRVKKEIHKNKKEIAFLKSKINKISNLEKISELYRIGRINKEKIDCEIELFEGYGLRKEQDNEKSYNQNIEVIDEKISSKIIVSLTSFQERIYDVHYCIYSLINQDFKADKIILWLVEDEFPNLEKDLPFRLLNLKKYGLEIKFINKNLKSYNKLVHALKEYPKDIIVTADDDVFYPKNWIKEMYENYDGENIICHRAHEMIFEKKFNENNFKNNLSKHHHEKDNDKNYKKNQSIQLIPYYSGKTFLSQKISILNFFAGVGGVMYPPNSFHQDVFNEELFLNLAPHNDDEWFWAMVVLNNKKIKIIEDGYRQAKYINPERELGLNNERTLWIENKLGRNNNEFRAILNHYLILQEKLLEILIPKYSLIVPCQNFSKYLPELVNSIEKQEILKNEFDYEVIFVDDGSTDNSLSIIKNVCNEKQNWTYVSQTNQGMGSARDIGLELAKGSYVFFISDIDWVEKFNGLNKIKNFKNNFI